MEKTILSIDCGTQSLRAMIFSIKGELLAIKKVTYEPYQSLNPGWAEQEVEVYWKALTSTCQALRNDYPNYFELITGVGVTTLRNSMVCVDEQGNPVRPIITWLDQRKAKPVYKPRLWLKLILSVMRLNDTIEKAQCDGKCNWIRQNQPDIWENTHKYLQVSGYLNFRLTESFTDSVASQIGYVPFDYKKQRWDNQRNFLNFSAKLYPVEPEKLPELVTPGSKLGNISKKAARETGLPEGLPVIACGSDKGCETIGMGVLNEKRASLSFGTTATIQTTSKKYLEPIRFMPSYTAVVKGHFNPEIEIFRGFWMITWFKTEFAHKEVRKAKKKGITEEEVLDGLLKKSPPGSMGLITQPYWSPGLSEPAAKGSMIGFGDVHKKPHIYRSVIEGLIFALLDGKEKIEKVTKTKVEKLTVSGGASKSDEVCQIAADIFNTPIVRGVTTETSGLGAAVLTAVGTGIYRYVNEAIENMVRFDKEFLPDKEHVELYHRLHKKVYKKMYKTLEPLYYQIRKITGYPE